MNSSDIEKIKTAERGSNYNMSKKNIKKTLLSSTAMMMALTTAIPSTVVPSNAYHNIDSISERTLEKAIETAKLERAEITNITAKSNVESLENLVDGNTDTFVDSQYWNWESTATSPQVLTFELTETVKLNKVRLHPRKTVQMEE